MTAQTLLAPTARQSSRTTAYVMTVGYSVQMHRWRPGVRLYWQLPGNRRGPHMSERGRAHYEGWLLRAQAGGRHFKTYTICSQDRTHLSGWKYYFLHLRSLLSTRSPLLYLSPSHREIWQVSRGKNFISSAERPLRVLHLSIVGDSAEGRS